MSAHSADRLHLASPQATTVLAARMAPALRAGDTLLLEGAIGAGKTHFARSLIQARLSAAGLAEDVPSPTYTLIQTYCDGAAGIWHADLYRLGDTTEVVELGLEEAFGTSICLVEWPDRLGDLAPADALTLSFAQGREDHARLLTVSGPADRRAALFSARDRAAHG